MNYPSTVFLGVGREIQEIALHLATCPSESESQSSALRVNANFPACGSSDIHPAHIWFMARRMALLIESRLCRPIGGNRWQSSHNGMAPMYFCLRGLTPMVDAITPTSTPDGDSLPQISHVILRPHIVSRLEKTMVPDSRSLALSPPLRMKGGPCSQHDPL
jgi:hypothetical protein